MKKVIIIGTGGHAKVIVDIIEKSGDEITGFLDKNREKSERVLGYPVLGNEELDISNYMDHEYYFFIGIGDNHIRKLYAEQFSSLQWYTAIHPSAILARDVSIGEGTVVMANVVIDTSARIGKHCIINTGSIIEHDDQIEDYVHISPNTTLCGYVLVGASSHIGAGAVIRDRISVCADVIVGAGGVVVSNITESGMYIGVPAKKVYK